MENMDTAVKEGFLKRKLIVPLLSFLKQGVTAHKLALSVAIGAVLGVFPILGVTTVLCVFISLIFKLNMPAMQLVNYFMYPVQLLVLIPMLDAGAWLFDAPMLPFSISELLTKFDQDLSGTFTLLGWTIGRALVVWIAFAPFGIAILYGSCYPIFKKVARVKST